MKRYILVAWSIALALLINLSLAQTEPKAAEWLEKARVAHGEALITLTSYQDDALLLAYDAQGAVQLETPVKTILDLKGERLRMEVYEGTTLNLVQQVTPAGAFAWSRQGGELPLSEEQVRELKGGLTQGIFGLREGAAAFESATFLGERTFEDVSGQALDVMRQGQTATLLLADDGTLLAERYTSSQLGETTVVYRSFEEVDGVKVPTLYDTYVSGTKVLSTEVQQASLSTPLTDDAFATENLAAEVKFAPEALAWVEQQAIPIATVDAGTGFEDLEPLHNLIGDARIVALGEQTHGSSEFFRMKQRLLEFLASEMGFTVFALEANMPEAYRLNEYVLTGDGDPAELLEGMHFWTWNAQEMLDLIEWMRAFNASGKGPVQFTGFDMQFPDLAAQEVQTFVLEHDPAYAAALATSYTEVLSVSPLKPQKTAPRDDLAQLALQADAVLEHLKLNQPRYLKEASPAEVSWVLQNARVVAQATRYTFEGRSYRDRAMAENVRWLQEQNPDAKLVLWAHNGHIQKREGWMGHDLAETYGDAYLAIGFSFGEGSYNATNSQGEVTAETAASPLPMSVDAFLKATGLPRFILDLRDVEATPAAPWLAAERLFRSIGAVAVPASAAYAPATLSEDYDFVVFSASTTASHLLR